MSGASLYVIGFNLAVRALVAALLFVILYFVVRIAVERGVSAALKKRDERQRGDAQPDEASA